VLVRPGLLDAEALANAVLGIILAQLILAGFGIELQQALLLNAVGLAKPCRTPRAASKGLKQQMAAFATFLGHRLPPRSR
jgi:hypothetical protein